MTCKDCIHYEVCDDTYSLEFCGTEICKEFKDKSNFIELPCKVGDTVDRLALEALQEKAEREKGCEHCKTGEYRDLKGSCYSVDVFPFCPKCGRKLVGEESHDS